LLEELHSFAATAVVHVRHEQITVVAALQISKCRAIRLTLSGDGFTDGTSAYTRGTGGGGRGPGIDVAGIPFSLATLYSSIIKCICIRINR
jgi:hypothetical protein